MPTRSCTRWLSVVALLVAAGSLTGSAFAQKGGVDENDKYPPKPLNELDQRRQDVRDAYGQTRVPPDEVTPRVIYGADDRRDVYEIGGGETVIQGLQQGVCVVVSTSELTNNGNGTYTLSTAAWTTYGGSPVCSSEPFYQQETIGFCSGFLVGTDLVATAGHCVSSGDCGSTAYVFGFDQQSASVGPETVVSEDDVYFCTGIVDWAQSGDFDYSVTQVDRPVVGRSPMPVRHTGDVSNGDPLVMIGHPVTLPKKIDDGAVVKDAAASTGFFTANLDAYGGNSGSMVANLTTGVIEGILVRGNTDFVSSGGCLVSNVCPDTGCPSFEEVSKATSFSASIPELGLQVLPAGDTTHVGVVGGPFSDPTVVYTLSNPTGSSLAYTVTIVGGGTAPMLLNGGTSDVTGSLPGGGNTTVNVAIDAAAAAALGAGIYATDVEFIDETNSRTTTRTHTIEVGQTGFTVTPAGDVVGSGPVGGPFVGSQTYTVTSTHPTPVDVSASASDSWIAIDGGAGPAVFTLTGVGDYQTVTVGISAAAAGLPAGLYTGNASFTNDSGGSGSTSRDVSLDIGRYVYPSDDTPLSITDNSTITSLLTIGEAFCIGDVDVDINITHTYIGDLIVELESPSGTVVRLHNRTGSSADDIVQRYDDAGIPPDGPGALADFNGETSTGTWTLTVSDNAGGDTGSLNSWSLRAASSGGGCPPVAADFSVNVPVTVTSNIALQGSSSTGSFDSIIGSLPVDGTLSDPVGGVIAGVPYTLIGQGSTVDYTPPGGFVGNTSFTYKVNDGLDSNVATVTVKVGAPTVIHDFPLNSDPGWSTTGLWAFGVPTGGGSHSFDPTSGYTGSNVYGYNLAGDYTNNMPQETLTTGALDLTGYLGTKLEFQRWLGVESEMYDHASVEISTDGAAWTPVWEHTTGSFSESAWSLQSFDISAVADDQPTVYFRWIMGTTDASVTYPGWNIDDIQILGTPVPSSCSGDLNGDSVRDLTDLGILLLNFGMTGAAAEDGDLNGDTIVDLTDLGLFLLLFGVPCP